MTEDSDIAKPDDQYNSTDELLNQVLQNQTKQQKQLQDMHEKIGCLYMYMVFSIVVRIIALIINFLF